MEQSEFIALAVEEKLLYLFNQMKELHRKNIEIINKQMDVNNHVYEQIERITDLIPLINTL